MAQSISQSAVLSIPKSLLDHARDVVWRADRDGRLTYLNRTGEQLFGRSLHSLEAATPWWSEVVHPEDHQSFVASLVTEPATELSFRVVRPDGACIVVRQHVQRVTNFSGETETLAVATPANVSPQSDRALGEAEVTPAEGLVAVAPPDGRPMCVLLVEDGLVNQRLAKGFLERAGHQVTVAENGEAALRAWEKQPFDLILMDVQMPIMDGLEATAVIRQREAVSGKRIPIIAMTAAAMKGDKERCLEVGMDDYVSKPIAADALFATMARHLAGPAEPAPAISAGDAVDQKEIVDFDTALTQVPGGVEVLRDLARMFLMECPKLLKDLRRGLADENVEATQRAAHTLKGAARILATNRLAGLAGQLEKLAKDKQLDAVRSQLGEIEAAVDQACGIIKVWCG